MQKNRRIVLIDVMDTLVKDPFYAGFPRFHEMTLDALFEAKDAEAWCRFERGEIDEARYVETAFKDGRWFDVCALRNMLQEEYAWLEGMETLLDELKGQGIELFALSNYPVWYELIEEKLSLSRYLSWQFVSCLTGHRKPHLRAYQLPLEALSVSPAQCVFIDDRASNCEAAESMGIRAHGFQSAALCRTFLQNAGFLGATP